MTSNFRPQETRLMKLNALVGTKVSIKKVSVETDLKRQQRYYGSEPSIKVIDISLSGKKQRGSLRGTSLSIIQREYHNESTEKSPTVLAHDRHLSDLPVAGVVDLSHGVEAVDLFLTYEVSSFWGSVATVGRKTMAPSFVYRPMYYITISNDPATARPAGAYLSHCRRVCRTLWLHPSLYVVSFPTL